MSNLKKLICGFVLLSILATFIHASLATPRPAPGYEDLKTAAACYDWDIMDVVVSEEYQVITVYYHYTKGTYASDDTDWIQGLDTVVTWAIQRMNLRGLVIISLYKADAYTTRYQPAEAWMVGGVFVWSAEAIQAYLMNQSRFQDWFQVAYWTDSLAYFGEGRFLFVGQPWEPDPEGLWGHITPKEREVKYPAHN